MGVTSAGTGSVVEGIANSKVLAQDAFREARRAKRAEPRAEPARDKRRDFSLRQGAGGVKEGAYTCT